MILFSFLNTMQDFHYAILHSIETEFVKQSFDVELISTTLYYIALKLVARFVDEHMST